MAEIKNGKLIFKVATYNIAAQRYCLDDTDAIGRDIAETGADIVGLQEVDMFTKRTGERDMLAEIAPLAEARKLVLSVENFPGMLSPFVTAEDFFKAKALVPSLKLTFDNGNAATGEDQVSALKACAGDIVHVHLKDWERSETAAEGFRQMLDGAWYCPALIGEGVVDSCATLRALEETGYDGFINIEYENNKYRADEGVRKVLEFLRAN